VPARFVRHPQEPCARMVGIGKARQGEQKIDTPTEHFVNDVGVAKKRHRDQQLMIHLTKDRTGFTNGKGSSEPDFESTFELGRELLRRSPRSDPCRSRDGGESNDRADLRSGCVASHYSVSGDTLRVVEALAEQCADARDRHHVHHGQLWRSDVLVIGEEDGDEGHGQALISATAVDWDVGTCQGRAWRDLELATLE